MSTNFREILADLPANLANHVKLCVIALVVGVLVSVPLGIYVNRVRWLRYPVLTVASVIQTVPGLALLALMVPLLVYTGGLGLGLSAFGFYPAVIALTLYSFLPILRNTVTGIEGVDPDMVEAARGVGMSQRQVLMEVLLPLSAPTIIAGIRTATVWVVGAATLATPVGQKCLGNYIFAGLQTKNWVMVSFGVVASAGLAIILDTAIGGLERAWSERRRKLAWISGGVLTTIVILGLIAPRIANWMQDEPPVVATGKVKPGEAKGVTSVRIGTKTFTEQYILAQVIAKSLRAAGVSTSVKDSLGSTVIFDALSRGTIDVYVDYSGTIWANYMKRRDTPAPWQVMAETTGWLAKQHGIRNLGNLGFENAYVLAMKRTKADKLGVKSIRDLAKHASSLKVGGDYEFFSRPEWRALRSAYGLRFSEKTSYDSTLMYEAVKEGNADVIAAFSSDGRIAAYDLALLDDPFNAIPPYDAILLVSKRVANDARVVRVLQKLVGQIKLGVMQRANLMVDRDSDKKTASQAADWLLQQFNR